MFEQKEALDFQKAFPPIIKWKTIRSVTTIATYPGQKISQMVAIVLKEQVQMKQLEGFINS